MDTMGGVVVVRGARSWRALAGACVFLALILAVAWPAPVRATTLESMTIDQMARRATTIVEGTVLSTTVGQSSYGVRTAVRIKVKDSLKGSASAVQTVYVPGGVLSDGTHVIVDSMASFRPGESCYVFVDRRGWVMGGYQGKVGIEDGRVTGSGETVGSMSERVKAALGRAGLTEGTASGSLERPVSAVLQPLGFGKSVRLMRGSPGLAAASLGLYQFNATTTIFADGFEGSAPPWDVAGYPTWATTTYRASSGSRSAYCAGSAISPPGPYANSMMAWLVAGPFDLSTVTAASLQYKLYVNSELNHDWISSVVSVDGDAFYGWGTSGNSQGWIDKSRDLTAVPTLGNVCGRSQVWIAFTFESDSSITGEGAYVDDVALLGGGSPPPPSGSPTISSISPGEASAGTDSHVTISGSGFGSSRGKVEFSYGRKSVMRISAGDISSWTDTAISCAVPTGVIDDYPASAGSGPVVVTTASFVESNSYDVSVPFGYGGFKWASPGVTYLVNTSGLDSVRRESLVDAGTAVWNGAGSAYRFTDGGLTSAGFANDGLNIISWANGLPEGVLAWARSYASGGIVSQCDIQFSNAYVWADGAPGSNTYDIQGIAMHEVGHWLRLLDQYMPGDSGKVMYGFGDENQQKRTLSAGDIAGIRWIYPGVGPSAPTVTSFLPTSGPVGTVVTITGTGFTGATAVAFNGAAATFTAGGATQITATVPGGATSGPIAVTTPGGTGTSATSFTVTVSPTAPTVTSFLPTSGPVGTVVTVTGTGFTGATAVAFNGAAAVFTVGGATRITATVPGGATSGPIAVITPGGTGTSAASFSVTGPPSTDTTPPLTTAYGYDANWHSTPVTVSFSAVDPAPNASGVAYTEYRMDGGAWTRGTQVVVPAPPDLKVTHTIGYRSADNAGNLEAEKSCQVKIDTTGSGDTVGPVCAAKNVTVKHDRSCRLSYKVHDDQSAQVTVHLAITTRSGVVKKRWSWNNIENYDGWWSVRYTCRLAKGTYRIVVTGEDLAGNSASVTGRATLKVKK